MGRVSQKLARKMAMIRKGIELPEIGYVSQTVHASTPQQFVLN
jgi:hypothetical protein